MPFEVLETQNKENMPPMASLSYLRHVRKGHEMDRAKIKPRLIVTLPTVICISQKKRFQIMVGTGEDAGKIRIVGVADKKGGCVASEFKSHVMLRFGYVPALGDEIFDGVKAGIIRVNDDTYDLDVPRELFKEAAVNTMRSKMKVSA